MSTRVKVYIYEEDMDKEPLRSRGFLDTGVESLIQKCKNTEEENSEEWDKLPNSRRESRRSRRA